MPKGFVPGLFHRVLGTRREQLGHRHAFQSLGFQAGEDLRHESDGVIAPRVHQDHIPGLFGAAGFLVPLISGAKTSRTPLIRI
jgi:hypothetical protein